MDRFVQKLDKLWGSFHMKGLVLVMALQGFPIGGMEMGSKPECTKREAPLSGGVWYAKEEINHYSILPIGADGPRIALVHKKADADMVVASKPMRRCLERALVVLRNPNTPPHDRNVVIVEILAALSLSNGVGTVYADMGPAPSAEQVDLLPMGSEGVR